MAVDGGAQGPGDKAFTGVTDSGLMFLSGLAFFPEPGYCQLEGADGHKAQ
jgi:hypothetical protein